LLHEQAPNEARSNRRSTIRDFQNLILRHVAKRYSVQRRAVNDTNERRTKRARIDLRVSAMPELKASLSRHVRPR
jgi:hypothetical protein